MKDYEEVSPGDISVNPDLTRLLVDVVKKYTDNFEAAGREIGHDVVVAGGAVRDILLGYKPKDLDVFVTNVDAAVDLDDENVYYTETLRRLTDGLYGVPFRPKGEQYPISSGLCVYGYVYGAYPVDVMTTTKTLEETLDSFDHDLVQCYMKEGKYYVSPNFLAAVKANRVSSRDQNTHYRLKGWKSRTGSKITVGMPPKIKIPLVTEYTVPPTSIISEPRIWRQEVFARDLIADQFRPFMGGDIEPMDFNMIPALERNIADPMAV